MLDETVITNSVLSTTTITSLYADGTGAEVCVTAGCAGGGTSTSTATSTNPTQADFFGYWYFISRGGVILLMAYATYITITKARKIT